MWLGSANTCITCRRPPSSHVGSAARSSPRIFCTHTRAPTSERTILEHIFIASICRFLLLHTVAVFFGRLSCNMNLVKVSVSLNHPGLIDYSGCSVCMCVCVFACDADLWHGGGMRRASSGCDSIIALCSPGVLI